MQIIQFDISHKIYMLEIFFYHGQNRISLLNATKL